jgi:chemotaxis protein histidine kinase CheA
VVIKPLAKDLAHHRGLTGSAILGDGRVALILDPHRLVAADAA